MIVRSVKQKENQASLFTIALQDGESEWEIERNALEILALNRTLLNIDIGKDHISAVADDVNESSVAKFIADIVKLFGSELLHNQSVSNFLDNCDTISNITHFRLRLMSNQINALTELTERLHAESLSAASKTDDLAAQVALFLSKQNEKLGDSTGSGSQTGSDENGSQTKRNSTDGDNSTPELSHQLVRSYNSSLTSDSTRGSPSGSQSGRNNGETGSSSGNNSGSEDSSAANNNLSLSCQSELYNVCSQISTSADSAVEALMEILQSHEDQVRYRKSAVGFLKKQIRQCIHSSAFETGLHELCCNLPDDSLQVSAIICKNALSNWQKTLSDALKSEAEADQPYYEMVEPEYAVLGSHAVTNPSITSDQMNYQVNCLVDSLGTEISANARNDLCMLAFLEEVSNIIGENNLFKRSLLLIRAWWVYETASYVGSSIKNYLSDFSLCIMVCAIFNQYHSQIGSPLQALCLFLTEYSGYDGATHAITLQGLVAFSAASGGQLKILRSTQHLLFGPLLMDRFWQVFNILPPASGGNPKVNIDELKNSLVNRSSADFVRLGFNVVHPFTHANMVVEKLSTRRLGRISTSLREGSDKLLSTLKAIHALTGSDSEVDASGEIRRLLLTFFANSVAKFKDNPRPDTFPGVTSPTAAGDSVAPLVSLTADTAKIWKSIDYCNLIMESILSEASLLTLTSEVLAEKGALPVGEVGKTLTEMTGIANLSQRLKEKFGGLKKFLERFKDLFAFSNDHPFNPHVLLRCSVTKEQLFMIDSGLFPPALMMKSKKQKNALAAAAAQPLSHALNADKKAVMEAFSDKHLQGAFLIPSSSDEGTGSTSGSQGVRSPLYTSNGNNPSGGIPSGGIGDGSSYASQQRNIALQERPPHLQQPQATPHRAVYNQQQQQHSVQTQQQAQQQSQQQFPFKVMDFGPPVPPPAPPLQSPQAHHYFAQQQQQQLQMPPGVYVHDPSSSSSDDSGENRARQQEMTFESCEGMFMGRDELSGMDPNAREFRFIGNGGSQQQQQQLFPQHPQHEHSRLQQQQPGYVDRDGSSYLSANNIQLRQNLQNQLQNQAQSQLQQQRQQQPQATAHRALYNQQQSLHQQQQQQSSLQQQQADSLFRGGSGGRPGQQVTGSDHNTYGSNDQQQLHLHQKQSALQMQQQQQQQQQYLHHHQHQQQFQQHGHQQLQQHQQSAGNNSSFRSPTQQQQKQPGGQQGGMQGGQQQQMQQPRW